MNYIFVTIALIVIIIGIKHALNKYSLKCRIYGCEWRFNFPSMPNKSICKRCKAKAELNLRTLEWESVSSFDEKLGTDDEIVNRWKAL